jgi:hypothetical protein
MPRVPRVIRQSKDDHARLIQDAKRENVAKVEIARDDNAAIRARSFDKDNVWSSLESKSSVVSRFVTKLRQELDDLWRDPSIRQKTHASGSESVQLVLSQGGGMPEGLADVLFLEVGQFLHDLRRSHAVGNEVDNMGDGNPKTAHGARPAKISGVCVMRSNVPAIAFLQPILVHRRRVSARLTWNGSATVRGTTLIAPLRRTR